jgi:hypothetical protein
LKLSWHRYQLQDPLVVGQITGGVPATLQLPPNLDNASTIFRTETAIAQVMERMMLENLRPASTRTLLTHMSRWDLYCSPFHPLIGTPTARRIVVALLHLQNHLAAPMHKFVVRFPH